jgi:hypothetical protein
VKPDKTCRFLVTDPRLVSGLSEAKSRGYAPGRFSFNVKGGERVLSWAAGALSSHRYAMGPPSPRKGGLSKR